MHRPLIALPVTLLALAGPLAAQTVTKVLPDGFGYDRKMGSHPVSTYWSGSYARNMQVFAKANTNITTAVLTEIQYRRTGSATFVANTKDVVMRLGYTRQTPSAMSARFSTVPEGVPTLVYQGKVDLPLSTPGPGLEPWAFGVKFTKPYTFVASKGNLLVDVETSSVAATDWWIDAVLTASDWTSGKTAELGEGCNSSNNEKLKALIDRPHLAAPGRTMRSLLTNAPNKTSPAEQVAVHFLGFSKTSWGSIRLPLTLPTGCKVYTGIEVLQVVQLEKPQGNSRFGYAYWPIPGDSRLAKQKVFSQWLMLDTGANAMDLILSNAQEVTIGAAGQFRYPTQSNWSRTRSTDHASQSSFAFAGIIRLVGTVIR